MSWIEKLFRDSHSNCSVCCGQITAIIAETAESERKINGQHSKVYSAFCALIRIRRKITEIAESFEIEELMILGEKFALPVSSAVSIPLHLAALWLIRIPMSTAGYLFF